MFSSINCGMIASMCVCVCDLAPVAYVDTYCVFTEAHSLLSLWRSRVRRNSEKIGNPDRQRKRLDKKAASSANLLTRSPSLEK